MLKTYDYIITLKPAKSFQAYDWISQLLLFTAIVSFVYVSLTTSDTQLRTAGFIFAALVAAAWIFGRARTGNYGIALSVAGVGWYGLLQNWQLTALYCICSILEKQVKFKRELGFDDEGVTINTFPKKNYQWHQINNVVLKDGIITLDLYNNRIMQRELEDEPSDRLEKEFNEFCRSHLLSV